MFNHLKQSASVFSSKLKRVNYLFFKSSFALELYNMEDVYLYAVDDLFK